MESQDKGPAEVAPKETEKQKVTLSALKECLQQNPDVYLADTIVNDFFLDVPNHNMHNVTLFVAPRSPIFDANKLNQFTSKVFANFEPPRVSEAENITLGHGKGGIRLGSLFYEEDIGTSKNIITFDHEEPEIRAEFAKKRKRLKEVRKIKRKISIHILPDPISVELLLSDYKRGMGDRTENQEIDALNTLTSKLAHGLTTDGIAQLKAYYEGKPLKEKMQLPEITR